MPGTPWNLFASRTPTQKFNFLSVPHSAENWKLRLPTGPKAWSQCQLPNASSPGKFLFGGQSAPK